MIDPDIDAFFATDVFGQMAAFTRTGYPAVSIPVIFDAPGAVVTLADGTEYETTAPKILCRTMDIPNVAHGDAVNVDGKSYKVIGISTDGSGITTLTLSEMVMADAARRDQIVAAIVIRLKGILVSSGYQTDAGRNVFLWRTTPLGQSEVRESSSGTQTAGSRTNTPTPFGTTS